LTDEHVFVMIEHMFVWSRVVVIGVALVAVLLVALGAARPSSGASPGGRYVVRSGDTLWGIASEHYGGDVRAAVWRIRDRNALAGSGLLPGQVLVLP
jgi:LysM repeat protein